MEIITINKTSTTSNTVKNMTVLLDFTTQKKYNKILITISYYRSSMSYLKPSSIYFNPYTGHSNNVNVIKEGEIVGDANGISYTSYLLIDELEEGEKFYAGVGFNFTSIGSSGSVNKNMIVTAFGIN